LKSNLSNIISKFNLSKFFLSDLEAPKSLNILHSIWSL